MKQVKRKLWALAMSALDAAGHADRLRFQQEGRCPAADSNTETQEPAADTTSSKLDPDQERQAACWHGGSVRSLRVQDLDANFAGAAICGWPSRSLTQPSV